MANESSPRLTTADLRRRLLAPASSLPVAPVSEPAPPVSARRPVAGRLVVPAGGADLATEEDDGAILQLDYVEAESFSASNDPTPVPMLKRPSGVDLVRPIRQSGRLTRPQLGPSKVGDLPAAVADGGSHFGATIDAMRQENVQLQHLLDEMRQLLQDASEQEQRMQTTLAEKEMELTEARAKITVYEEQINTKPKTRTELEEWADELEQESFKIAQERREMEEDRRQLREDEKSLEKQMREMEVGMARERAMLARQEQELKRLNSEIQHELEVMRQGGGTLRDRLAVFQRRHAEVVAGAPTSYGSNTAIPVAQSVVSQATTTTPPPKKNDTTGLLRKLFRSE